MPKIGNVVDAETASKYASIFQGTRAIIWPKDKAASVKVDGGTYHLPQRYLCHLLCNEDSISAFYCLPMPTNEAMMWCICCGVVPYVYDRDFVEQQVGIRFGVTVSEKGKKIYASFPQFRGDQVFTCDELLSIWKHELDVNDEKRLFAQTWGNLIAMEHFAFSPLTTTRLRLTVRHKGNPRKYPLRFQPIEIVNLRLPEKVDHPESTGRSINLRFPVIEHLRRIKDKKTGEERLTKVRAHMRGPEDAPLKPETEKVYKVTR